MQTRQRGPPSAPAEFSAVQSQQMTGSLLVMTCSTWILSGVNFHFSGFYSMVWCTNNLLRSLLINAPAQALKCYQLNFGDPSPPSYILLITWLSIFEWLVIGGVCAGCVSQSRVEIRLHTP